MSGAPPRAPRLRPTLERVRTPDGHLLLVGGPDGDAYELAGDADQLDAFVSLLDGTRTVEQIATELGTVSREEITEALGELLAAGLVDDAADDARWLSALDIERFDRQLRYFGDVAPGAPRARAQARLGEASVAVLGLGGLGGMAALLLTAAGLGRIVGVDDDRVELSNLARQVTYDEADVAALKTEATERRLGRLNGALGFEGHQRAIASEDDVAALVAGTDLVIAAVDRPAYQVDSWIDRACFRLRIPYIGMSQHPPLIRVGPLLVPGRTGCHACRLAEAERAEPLHHALVAAAAPQSPAASYAPACGVIGALVANEAIAYLTGLHEPTTLGAAIVLDLRTLEVERVAVPRRPGCEVCAHGAASG